MQQIESSNINILDTFLQKYYAIEKQLNDLNKEYNEFYTHFSGETFPEQKILAEDKIKNLITYMTHEIATDMGFQRQALMNLVKYIEFRKLFKTFSESDFENIIDSDNIKSLNILNIYKNNSTLDKKDIVSTVKNIRLEWNKMFKNKTFKKIKSEIDK